MADVHFVKEGGGDGYARRMHTLPATEASAVFEAFVIEFHETAPVFNPDISASKDSPPKFVVLEVDVGEETSKFPKAGYYLISGLNPGKCARKLSIYF